MEQHLLIKEEILKQFTKIICDYILLKRKDLWLGMLLVVKCSWSMYKRPSSIPNITQGGMLVCVYNPSSVEQSQEDQGVKVILFYIGNLKTALDL